MRVNWRGRSSNGIDGYLYISNKFSLIMGHCLAMSIFDVYVCVQRTFDILTTLHNNYFATSNKSMTILKIGSLLVIVDDNVSSTNCDIIYCTLEFYIWTPSVLLSTNSTFKAKFKTSITKRKSNRLKDNLIEYLW